MIAKRLKELAFQEGKQENSDIGYAYSFLAIVRGKQI